MSQPPAAAAQEVFLNYTRLPQRVPDVVWNILRSTVLLLTLVEIFLLFYFPAVGLSLFWGITVPLLPACFAVAPGLWRQLCPMAFANQIPRMLGFGRALTLPAPLRFWSYIIAISLLVSLVSIRSLWLNQTGWAVGLMCSICLLLAFVGGVFYKGRSGWCGTFCPIAPVQRSHGQAPLVVVRNGYCPSCVGCQKNCFDFNPRAAIFGDLEDKDPRYAMQRMIFMSSLPGIIWGYYNVAGTLDYGFRVYLVALAGSMFFSSGLFFTLRGLLKISSYRMVTGFGIAALLIYYYYAGPILITNLAHLFDALPPEPLLTASRYLALPIAGAILPNAVRAERAYRDASESQAGVRVDTTKIHSAGLKSGKSGSGITICERGSGSEFSARSDQSILEAMEEAGMAIDYGCRSGLCGADPVGIVDGHECLSAVGNEERATLRRLGLEGRARLACCARASGPVTIDRDPRSVPAPAAQVPLGPAVDRARELGIARVLVIGNGVAGITLAETLRSASASVDITLIADEPHHFYNRMAIGRVIYSASSMDGMYLVPDDWYKSNRITVFLNTAARSIDRSAKLVHLGTGEALPYDRLVLATGARAAQPVPGFTEYSNAFVLRTAGDAQSIRAAIQQRGAKHAVVIGGGVLGIEAAEAMANLGLKVSILQRGRRLMDKQLDAEGAQVLTKYLGDRGIEVVPDCKQFEIVADADSLTMLKPDDGREYAADVYVACAGIVPEMELARSAGLDVGRGIKTDAAMQTSDANIFAVGDVVDAGAGIGGLWPVAVSHAHRAVASMLGTPGADGQQPIVLQLKSDGIDLRSFGKIDPVPVEAEVMTAKGGETWWRLVILNGAAIGAVLVGPPGSARSLTRMLQEQADFTPYLDSLRQGKLSFDD